MNPRRRHEPLAVRIRRACAVAFGASGCTLALFFVLPLLQAMAEAEVPDTDLLALDTVVEPPPPPPEEPEEEKPPEPEEPPPPPAVDSDAPPPDLSQLELALNPDFGDGAGFGSDVLARLQQGFGAGAASGGTDSLFSLSDLDQPPRAVYQTQPLQSAEVKKKAPGTVYVVFDVDASGKVANPRILDSPDPVFDRPALAAVKQWRFEPGKRNGKPVPFRMKCPITFKKGS